MSKPKDKVIDNLNSMSLNKLRDQAYKTACEHGFHDKELSNEHWLCLVISELMEAVEADRKGKRTYKLKFEKGFSKYSALVEEPKRFECAFEKFVKDTVEDELADAAIRLLDLYGLRKRELNEDWINEGTVKAYAKDFEGKSFTEAIYSIIGKIASMSRPIEKSSVIPEMLLLEIFGLAKHLNIDLLWHIEQKMKYNQSRERMHGKKY